MIYSLLDLSAINMGGNQIFDSIALLYWRSEFVFALSPHNMR